MERFWRWVYTVPTYQPYRAGPQSRTGTDGRKRSITSLPSTPPAHAASMPLLQPQQSVSYAAIQTQGRRGGCHSVPRPDLLRWCRHVRRVEDQHVHRPLACTRRGVYMIYYTCMYAHREGQWVGET